MARAQLLTVLAYLMVVTLAYRVQPVHRERRQSFDSTTSTTTNDGHSSYPSDTPADLSLTPLPTSDTENAGENVIEYDQILPEKTPMRPSKECEDKNYCFKGTCSGGMTCTCDEGWSGIRCKEHCTLDCGEHGQCMNTKKYVLHSTEKDMFCSCDDPYIGKSCQLIKPDKVAEAVERGDKIAIILSVSLVSVLIISTILLVILWRRRFIPIMNVIYFFKMAEDDDGKLYDAYISASKTGNAMTFVNETLAPKLEGLGFHLYIPSRDLLAGEVISDDIVEGIKQSRRTIMVVTPEYSMNAWSRFEVLNAQTETINLKHRMIPIILEDVSQEIPQMQKSLKHILESMKCLKVPGYKLNSKSLHHSSDPEEKKMIKFWKLLELTMPKRTNSNSNKDVEFQNNIIQELDINTLNELNAKETSTDQENNVLEKDLSGMLNRQSMSQHPTTSKYQRPSVNPNTAKYQNIPVDQSRSIFPNIAVHQNASQCQYIDAAKFKQCFDFKVKL